MFKKSLFLLLSSQYGFPKGFLGRYVGHRMDEQNEKQSDWVVSLLGIKKEDKVLDIGCATGRDLKKISQRINPEVLYGLDPSETMIQVAGESLKKEISVGKVKIFKGYAENPPFEPNFFNKIFAVHVVYFWKDLKKVFASLYRILQKE